MIQFKNEHCCIFESALFKTTTSVIWTTDLILVVDPTWLPEEVSMIRNFVDGMKGGRPVYLLFTHSDYDHILGFGSFPDATVIASEAFVNKPDKEAVIDQIRKFDHDYYVDRPYELVYPEVDISIKEDGQAIKIGQTKLQFYLAPGHNPDGIFTYIEPLKMLIVGDYMSDVEFPYIYHSFRAYHKTLDKLEFILDEMEPHLLIPGHGNVTNSIREMERRLIDSRGYLRRLKDAVKKEEPFPEAILWQRYKYPLGMQPFHLKNLELVKKELTD